MVHVVLQGFVITALFLVAVASGQDIRTDVEISEFAEFSECWREGFAVSQVTRLDSLFGENCTKPRLVVACRRSGQPLLTVAAEVDRNELLVDTGRSNVPRVLGGVSWYSSLDWSLGFAKAGDAINRISCDYDFYNKQANPHMRMCIQTKDGFLGKGFRCGNHTFLGSNNDWERVILQAGPRTSSPSREPTLTPSASPTIARTSSPSKDPTLTPSASPTLTPSSAPETSHPSSTPTFAPTREPTFRPSKAPRTSRPSRAPTTPTTFSPTHSPTNTPTASPTRTDQFFSGVKTDVNLEKFTKWELCWEEPFGTANATSVDELLNVRCTKKRLMLACRSPNTTVIATVAAQALREDVTFPTLFPPKEQVSKTIVPHVANGVSWYWNTKHSFGYAPAGQNVVLDECDVVDAPDRICIHFDRDFVYWGYRCGLTKFKAADSWYRMMLQTDEDTNDF